MKNLLIVYHTQSGNTGQLCQALTQGVNLVQEASDEPELALRCLKAANAKLEDLLWCDAVLFGTPENFGYMSGALKDFFDRTYYPAEPHELNLPYGLFISAGNDGTNAVRECDRILKGYPMKKVMEPLIARGEITQQHLDQASEMGQTMACGLTVGIY